MLGQLFKRRIIRDFLSLFSESYWKELIALLLEYGIIEFNKNYKISTLTPEDIINNIEKIKKEENIKLKKNTDTRVKSLEKNIKMPEIFQENRTNSKNQKSNSRINSTNKNSKNSNQNENIKSFNIQETGNEISYSNLDNLNKLEKNLKN